MLFSATPVTSHPGVGVGNWLAKGGRESPHVIVDEECFFCAALRMSVPWEIALDARIPDMEETSRPNAH